MKKWLKFLLITACVVLATVFIVFIFWGMNPVKASDGVKGFLESSDFVNVFVSKKGDVIFEPTNGKFLAGIVFYPGGHVEHIAYSPLAYMLAQKGMKVVVLKVPLSLAFFRINGAKEYIEKK